MPGEVVTVQAYKYGGIPHYRFAVRVLDRSPELMVVTGEYGRELIHQTRGKRFTIQNRSIEFYWPGRPYTVAADCSAEGQIRQYYCNINLPPVMADDRVEWVDLDLDLIVQPDLSWQVVDEEEFELHQVRYGYPPEVIQLARESLAALIRLVEAREYPFDGSAAALAGKLVR
ncbi:MAG: DUF402 domain-containing protein [Mycobacterium leprae]